MPWFTAMAVDEQKKNALRLRSAKVNEAMSKEKEPNHIGG